MKNMVEVSFRHENRDCFCRLSWWTGWERLLIKVNDIVILNEKREPKYICIPRHTKVRGEAISIIRRYLSVDSEPSSY